MRAAILVTGLVLGLPVAASAQGPTQSRDGLATASQGKGEANNGGPAGSVNAATGPQSRPAYPSGSTTANPGAAFVRTQPKPATGPAASPPGVLDTKTVTGAGTAPQSPAVGVGQAATPAK